MSVKARCLNYTGCLLAYRGEVIEIAQNAPLVCPECGKTVSVTQSKGGSAGKAILALLVLGALAAGGYYAAPKLKEMFAKKAETTEEAPDVPPSNTGTPPPDAGPTPKGMSGNIATPPPFVVSAPSPPTTPAKIDLSLAKAENQQVRDEVLKRVDEMKLTQANKDKLYNSVQRAKSMGLIITIPFGSGGNRLPPAEIPNLKAQLEKPEIAKMRADTTYVFVILGYADSKGDEVKNRALSRSRAESVVDAMRDKCGVENVMHAVAMGGSNLIDAKNLERNRAVEVWAVLP